MGLLSGYTELITTTPADRILIINQLLMCVQGGQRSLLHSFVIYLGHLDCKHVKGLAVYLFICYGGVRFFLGQDGLQRYLDRQEHLAIVGCKNK